MISVDIEADGPTPGKYSMIQLGAVDTNDFSNTFYGELRPISLYYKPDALNSFGVTREQTFKFPEAVGTMNDFYDWLSQFYRPRFMSDNPVFDGMFVFWYLDNYCPGNPFGFSGFSLTSWAQGAGFKDWKRKYRKTKHTHNALDDAMGNAEAYNTMMGLIRGR